MYFFRNKKLYQFYTERGSYREVGVDTLKHLPNFEEYANRSYDDHYIVYITRYNNTFVYDLDTEKVCYRLPIKADYVEFDNEFIYLYKYGKNNLVYLTELYTYQEELLYRFTPDYILDVGKKWDLIYTINDFQDSSRDYTFILEDYYLLINQEATYVSIYTPNKQKIYGFKLQNNNKYLHPYILDKQYFVLPIYGNISVYNAYGELLNNIEYNPDFTYIYRHYVIEMFPQKYIVKSILGDTYEIIKE